MLCRCHIPVGALEREFQMILNKCSEIQASIHWKSTAGCIRQPPKVGERARTQFPCLRHMWYLSRRVVTDHFRSCHGKPSICSVNSCVVWVSSEGRDSIRKLKGAFNYHRICDVPYFPSARRGSVLHHQEPAKTLDLVCG